MRRRFLLLSFIEGAAVMTAEICGAKLLAPVYGSSLYVWSSVMGITLLALAIGYFYGGMKSAKSPNQKKSLFNLLVISSLFVILMPVLSYYLLLRISFLPFIPAVISSTLLLLFLPVFLLGATSPFFIAVQSSDASSAGKVSGIVYAVSTLGGIIATFLCGFLLLPVIGINATLFATGVLLFVSALIVFRSIDLSVLLLFAGIMFLNFRVMLSNRHTLLQSDGIMGKLEVLDMISEEKDIRLLLINGIIQTEMDNLNGRSVSNYIRLLDTLIPSSSNKNALVLGLGGGLTANLFVEKKYRVTGVEFDCRIIEAAKKFFHLQPTVTCRCEDARYFINRTEDKYDLVLVDIFKAEEQPDHVITLQSLEKLKANLNANAGLYINWHGYTTRELGMGTAIMKNTLETAGFKVRLCSYSADENSRNVIFVASLDNMPEIPESFVLNEALPQCSLVNSDNCPLLEKYNAEANKSWRKNYLLFYRGPLTSAGNASGSEP